MSVCSFVEQGGHKPKCEGLVMVHLIDCPTPTTNGFECVAIAT